MTSVDPKYFEKHIQECESIEAHAKKWLAERKVARLSDWLLLNNFEIYDLVDTGVIAIESAGPVPMSLTEYHTILTPIGLEAIGIIPAFLEPEFESPFDSGFELHKGYIKDEKKLTSLLSQQTEKILEQRTKLYLIVENLESALIYSSKRFPGKRAQL